jgi:pyruvate-ferredoxin/flavodoxin oxidoreductase
VEENMAIKKIFHSIDGNTAAALASYNFTEVAGIYPITPSTQMAELADVYASQGKLNYFGSKARVVEMQSEGGAAGTVHGALQAGSYATTYTASQGLLLMIPNMYKWVGELLPAVLHVAARSIATRALSIFGDHQDIYAVRQTGTTMLCSHSVQEVADLTPTAHLIAMESQAPMVHFFDGFRTSHEIQNIEMVADEEWKKLLPHDKINEFRARALNPHGHAVTRGGAENGDIYFQGREAQNKHYDMVLPIAEKYLDKVSKLTGREYAPFTYYGANDAEYVIIAMGSVTEALKEVIDTLIERGQKVGLVKVHLYRPFSSKHLAAKLPKSIKRVAVLDRTKEQGGLGEPLYVDVVAALRQEAIDVAVYGGRYGLSSKDTQPKHLKVIYDFLADKPHHNFTISITDDVTNLSIPADNDFQVKEDYVSCLFYGMGSDGTVSANKSSIKIIGEATGQYAQAYFAYDSRKAGGVTMSHLRFGKTPIRSTYYINKANFVSCSLDSYIHKFDMFKHLKDGGTFLLNTNLSNEDLFKLMPNRMKYQLAVKKAKFYVIDANQIAQETGMGRHTNTTLQSSFFYLNQGILPYDEARKLMKKYAEQAYGRKGQEVIERNFKAIDAGADGLREIKVDPKWIDLKPLFKRPEIGDDYWDTFVLPITSLEGDDLPVSKFTEFELMDGTMQNDITFKEQREIADRVPVWIKENCIQCNQCAFVCPHATIRAFLMNEEEIKAGPEVIHEETLAPFGPPDKMKGLRFRIQISPKNCVGCAICAVQCPGKGPDKKALQMVDAKSQFYLEEAAQYMYKNITYKGDIFPLASVKGAGFLTPYMEVSGACAGCGETPYYRLATQLFGRDMLIANATGCSSIYSGSTPLTPFCTDKNNEGVAWANSLFEDNAEFGYGMRLATDHKLAHIISILNENKDKVEPDLRELIDRYIDNYKDRNAVRAFVNEMVDKIKSSKVESIKQVLQYEKDLIDKSVWIIGGDGWAYDIGFGGLDHVLASSEDVNILVLDTEVYSNTGGQSSKASQAGSISKFTASGKVQAKKNLATMAMVYGHVYVAQISLGANYMQTVKALKEAEDYHDGPSLIIAYSPCVAHDIKGGLAIATSVQKKAVESGYFPIFRYDPRLVREGKSPLILDCKDPDFTKYRDFLMQETRFSSLPTINPEHAEQLLNSSAEHARYRWEQIKKFA